MLPLDLLVIFFLYFVSISGNLFYLTLRTLLFLVIVQKIARFAGIIENVGHDMTFKILNSSANKIVNRSNFRSANDYVSPNLRADHFSSPEVIKSLLCDKFKAEDSASKTTYEDVSLASFSVRPVP